MPAVIEIESPHGKRLSIGGGHPFALICGPCVIESEEHVSFLASEIRKLQDPFIFKASFDKANRSSIQSFRGPGLDEGIRILRMLREQGFLTTTDIHEAEQADQVADSVDIIQIPAMLCRQTDLLVAAGKTGRVVNIKKGQFVAPHDILHAVEKVQSTGNEKVMLTERGSTFGYNNLIVDMRGLAMMRNHGVPVFFDATHSVQLPGGGGRVSSGEPEYIETLSRAAIATEIDGLFVETHEKPQEALSDGATAVPLPELPHLLAKIRMLDEMVKSERFLNA
jgi:2-dehydro-3-deoxyphosphooctonate aldolase (KDO 8-P synthase)